MATTNGSSSYSDNNNNNTLNDTLILHISSTTIRCDWNDLSAIDAHILLPNSISLSTHFNNPSKVKISKRMEKEIMSIRGNLLVERKVIPKGKVEKENFLEPIKEFIIKDGPHVINHHDFTQNNLQKDIVDSIFSNVFNILSNVTKNDNLYYPIIYGILNYTLQPNLTLEILLYNIYLAITKLENYKNAKNILLIFSDLWYLQEDVKNYTKYILQNLQQLFPNLENFSLQKESLMSFYGSGITNNEIIILDFGFTKTGIYHFHNNKLQNLHFLPFGGKDIYYNILGMLQHFQSTTVLKNNLQNELNLTENDISKNIQNLDKLKIHLKKIINYEHFHNLDLQNTLQNNKINELIISDDLLYISSFVYFNKYLLPKRKEKEKLFNYLNNTTITNYLQFNNLENKMITIDKYITKYMKQNTTIVLIGGFSNLNNFIEYLKEVLGRKKLKHSFGNERDKLVHLSAITWKGGVILSNVMGLDFIFTKNIEEVLENTCL
ncbi:hypothetical protein ABK040_004668 [Willaertia magna]